MSPSNDVKAYQAALLETGIGVVIPAKGEHALCVLADSGTHAGYHGYIWGKKGETRTDPELAAPRDVALAIAHGRFKDGERRLLVLPSDPGLLARASDWARGLMYKFHHVKALEETLTAIVHGLSLGGGSGQRHYDASRDASGKRRPRNASAPGGGGSLHWFEIQVPSPEKRGLPGPCYIRGLRDENFWVSNVYLLRGTTSDPIPVGKAPPKSQKAVPVRLMVPGHDDKKPYGWIRFDAWSSMTVPSGGLCYVKISKPKWCK